jgi:hypothetical protein
MAHALLMCAEEAARATDMQRLYLHVVLADKGARALYDANGWKEMDRTRGIGALVNFGGTPRPRALMVKNL